METNQIMSADLLDIIFDGRNKDYGAYELRKTYPRRFAIAIITATLVSTGLFVSYLFATNLPNAKKGEIEVDTVTLTKIDPDLAQPPLPPLPPAPPEPPKTTIIKNTTPIIVREDVDPAEMPPSVDALEDAKIGNIDQPGIKGDDIVAPPVSDGDRRIIEAPKKNREESETPFTPVEIESIYPGGATAWSRYLNRTLKFPQEAQELNIQGTIIVQFIVDKHGNISEIAAISGPPTGGLREEAVRVIRQSGKWEPAIQNGRKVSSYKKQPVTFRLETE